MKDFAVDNQLKGIKIALVHDHLFQDGGAERVLRAFHEIWPDAPIFVLANQKGAVEGLGNATIEQSFIGKIPFGKRFYRWFLPWMPLATEKHNLHDFDIVLSSTSAFAKGILTRPETLHICYCHTPTRYLWTDTHEYVQNLKQPKFVKAFLPRLIHKLRIWDRMSVDRVDKFIANSNTVRERIAKYYRRDSSIIFPPVDTHMFSVAKEVGDYFVTGGRLVSYKRFDLTIEVFNRLGWKLKIFGTGPEMDELKRRSKDNIEFVGRVTDQQKAELISGAKAFIHPQLEDLGITPVESMSGGSPVIAYGKGGVTETVIPGQTGEFFYEQTWESLLDLLIKTDFDKFDRSFISSHADKFAVDQFKKKIKIYVGKYYDEFIRSQNICQLEERC